jgi:hypothetical protein
MMYLMHAAWSYCGVWRYFHREMDGKKMDDVKSAAVFSRPLDAAVGIS